MKCEYYEHEGCAIEFVPLSEFQNKISFHLAVLHEACDKRGAQFIHDEGHVAGEHLPGQVALQLQQLAQRAAGINCITRNKV